MGEFVTEVNTMAKPSLVQEVLGISLQMFTAIGGKKHQLILDWRYTSKSEGSFVEAPSDLRMYQALRIRGI